MENEQFQTALALIQLLSLEVASELELHYEPEEYYALGATIINLQTCREFLVEHNISIPDVVDNVINTFYRTQN